MGNLKKVNESTKSVITQKETEDRSQLKLLLIQGAEQKVSDKFSDKNLDRKNEIIELLSGKVINLTLEKEKLEIVVATAKKEYSPRVPQEYYREINRLNSWNKSDDKIYQKPPIVGRYTNEIIYSRYHKDVLPVLQHLNPYISLGTRDSKHFQWLTESGQKQYDIFIQDAISVMKECNNWYEFRVKHAKRFGVSFQLNLFEKKYNF